jgi:hypothetical protein
LKSSDFSTSSLIHKLLKTHENNIMKMAGWFPVWTIYSFPHTVCSPGKWQLFTYRLERILTMVYVVQNSQNFSGLFPSSCIPKNTTFRKEWLRLALSKGPNWVGLFSPTFTWGRKHIQFPKRRVFWNTGLWKNARKILWILYMCLHVKEIPFSAKFLLYILCPSHACTVAVLPHDLL